MGMLMTETGREFWRGVLAGGGFTAIPRWTLDPVAGVAAHEATIPDHLVAAVRRLADELAVPLSSVLLAAHAKVLAALSGEREVVTGYVAVAGGQPLPCGLTTGPGSWRTVLLDTHRAEAELLAHKDFPVDDLRRELGLSGPSFETVLDPTGDGGDLAGDTVLWVGIPQHSGRLVLRLRYRTDVLDAGCAARIAGYHLTALALIAADPDAEHGRQSLLSAEEAPLPARRARRAAPGAAGPPGARAVRAAGGGTPGRRRGRARRPAVDLLGAQRPCQPAGTGPAGAGAAPRRCRRGGDRAQPGLDGRRPGGLQGGWRVPAPRAAFPGWSHRDRAFSCRVRARADRTRQHHHAGPGPRLAARQSRRSSSTRPTRRTMPTGISASASRRTSSPTSSSPPAPPASPRARCASTRACSTTSTPRSPTSEIGEGQVVPQTGPQCFDISLWQLVAALLVGGRTLLVEQEVILDVQRFVDTIVDGRAAVLQVVPSYLDVVLSYLEQHPRELPDLHCVSPTGDFLKKELTQRWFAAQPKIKLVNTYGLTETSDDAVHETMDRVPDRDRVPLGRPINNVHVYVVDEHLSPVPLGAPGVIVFSGVCVGRGYINDPERTRQVFMADPHREGQRLCRSGDYGRWQPEGKLEFLGRRDNQVKIRGFRIEIGEIENALLRVPGVRDGAVVVAERTDRSNYLVAFYSGRRPLEAGVLRDRLAESLPEYMVPSGFHWRESLPLTANGKIDRKRLSALAGELEVVEEDYQAPRTPTEHRLAAAWAKVLGIPQEGIGRRDHFFDLGGTSLSAVRLAIILDRALSLKDVTRQPILADLARLVDGRSERRCGLPR